jgi:hypothetical protein
VTPEESGKLTGRMNGLVASMQQLGLIPVHVPEQGAPVGYVSDGEMPSLVLLPYRGAMSGECSDGHEHMCGCCGGKAIFAGPRTQGRCPHASLCARCRSVSWRNEACSRCGMDDLPVTGPEAERLCPYCDELQSLAVDAAPVHRRRRLPPARAVPLALIGLSAIGAGVPAVPVALVAVLAGIAVVLWAIRD